MAYDDLEISGLSGVLFDTRVIDADWDFVHSTINNGIILGRASGFGLGIMVAPKTIYNYFGTHLYWSDRAIYIFNIEDGRR